MKTLSKTSIALLLSVAVIWSIESFANYPGGKITIERRIATQANDIDKALASGIITTEEEQQLRADLDKIQAKDYANSANSPIADEEINRDLDDSEYNIEEAINYGK